MPLQNAVVDDILDLIGDTPMVRLGRLVTPGMAEVICKVEPLNPARRIAAESPDTTFMPQQFDNPANPEIHRKTTAREILEAVEGRLDAFVCGVGAGGDGDLRFGRAVFQRGGISGGRGALGAV